MRRTGAGQFDKLVTLQRATMTNDLGQLKATWSDVSTHWAKIRPKSGSAAPKEEGTRDLVMYEITLRNVSGITAKDRLKWGSKILNLSAPPVDVEGKGIEFILQATEEV